MEKIDFEGDCSIKVAASPNKLYVRGDSLLLVTTSKTGHTKLFTFNLPEQKVDQKVFTHKIAGVTPAEPTVGYVDNAYLLKDKIYYVWATYDLMGLEVMDLYSGKLVKEYKVGRDQEIEFKNTDIMQEGTSMSKNAVRTLDNTRQLMRKMYNGDAVVIAAFNTKGQVELTVGSYTKVGGQTVGTSGVGGTYSVSTGGFWRPSWTKSAHFKMLVDADTGEHVPGEIDDSINEKIERYTLGVKIPTEAENLYYFKGNYYYAFYNQEDRKLTIVRF
jgi:hypothetical protein